MKDYEKILEEGRLIQDMVQTEGWRIFEKRIKQEIEDERVAIEEVEKQPAFDMLVDFVSHQERMRGLGKILEIIEEYLVDKKDAENNLRQETN